MGCLTNLFLCVQLRLIFQNLATQENKPDNSEVRGRSRVFLCGAHTQKGVPSLGRGTGLYSFLFVGPHFLSRLSTCGWSNKRYCSPEGLRGTWMQPEENSHVPPPRGTQRLSDLFLNPFSGFKLSFYGFCDLVQPFVLGKVKILFFRNHIPKSWYHILWENQWMKWVSYLTLTDIFESTYRSYFL